MDVGLLARIDVRAGELGQTRRVFVEAALAAALGGPPPPTRGAGSNVTVLTDARSVPPDMAA